MNNYFKCIICGKIFDNNFNLIKDNNNIENKKIKFFYCKNCKEYLDYEKWELENYFNKDNFLS